MLESEVQERFIALCKARGWQAYAIAFRGRRGCPDTMVLTPRRYHCLVELKQVSEKARPLQGYYHRKLQESIDVYTAAGLAEARTLLDIIGERSKTK